MESVKMSFMSSYLRWSWVFDQKKERDGFANNPEKSSTKLNILIADKCKHLASH